MGLVVAAVVVAVVAFLIASPGGDDEGDTASQRTLTSETSSSSGTKAVVTRIDIRGGEVVGGAAEIKVKKGDTVLIVVSADAPDDIHLHGYDVEKKVEPGQPARFNFKANFEGEFEIESHVAEDAGRDPLVGTLIVEPR
jgi:plastocyanin